MKTLLLLLTVFFTICANVNSQIIKSFTTGLSNTHEAGASKFIDNGYIVTGKYYNSITQVNYITKYNLAGNIQWTKNESGGTISNFVSVAELSNGDLVFLAEEPGVDNFYSLVKTDSMANVIWSKSLDKTLFPSYEMPTMKVDNSDNVFVLSATLNKTHVFKLNAAGTLLWSKTLEVDNITEKNPGFDFEIMPDGGILFCGKAELDIFIVRLDALGNLMWTKRMNDNGLSYAHPRAITTLHDGNLLVAGFRGVNVSPYESGPFLLKFDPSGNIIDFKFYNDTVTSYSFIPNLVREMPDYSIKVMGNGGPLTFADFDQNLVITNYNYWSYITNCQTFTGCFDVKDNFLLATCSDRNSTQYILRANINGGDFCNLSSVETYATIDLPIKNELYTNDIVITAGPSASSSSINLSSVANYTHSLFCGTSEILLSENEIVDDNDLRVYPNPISANQELKIAFDNEVEFIFAIYDVTGKVVLAGKEAFTISIPQINAGTYLLVITNEKTGFTSSTKLLVN